MVSTEFKISNRSKNQEQSKMNMNITTCQKMAGNKMFQLAKYPRTQGEKSDSESGSVNNLRNGNSSRARV